jgi:hypothetical protein
MDQLDGEANGVLRLMGKMMRLPFTALIYSFEILVRTVRGMQRMTDQGFETLTGDNSQRASDANLNQQTTHEEEENAMWDDQDLSGDDLKYVSYSILFTKRDYETPLEREEQDLVDYPTNGGSYGGLKIAHFLEKVRNGDVQRPEKWRQAGYPPGTQGDTVPSIPIEDERYITFIYRVERRIPREGKEYDRDQVRELRGIKEGIHQVGNKIG